MESEVNAEQWETVKVITAAIKSERGFESRPSCLLYLGGPSSYVERHSIINRSFRGLLLRITMCKHPQRVTIYNKF